MRVGRHNAAAVRALFLGVAVALSSGCFDAPEIEDRWTRLDLLDAGLSADASVVEVEGKVTFRTILTGSVVAELCASDSIAASEVGFGPNDSREEMARGVALVLGHARSLGRETLLVTGFDHLERRVRFELPASGVSAGEQLFLVFYLADVDEIEGEDGEMREVVTPFDSEEREVLPAGRILAGLPEESGGRP